MAQLTKEAIIHRYELLKASVINHQMSLQDKDSLLCRLEEIEKGIIANRKAANKFLQQWDSQLKTIQNDLIIATVNYVPHTRRSGFARELISILSTVYNYSIKYIIVIAIIVGILAIAWTVIWQVFLPVWACSSVPFANFLYPHCKTQDSASQPDSVASSAFKNPIIKIPSIPTFVEKTTEIADRLSNVDVSASNKLTEIKISLIDLKARVSYSNIQPATKQILTKKIGELKASVEITTENIHKMLAAFGGTLSKLEIYTRYALTYITDESSALIISSSSFSTDTALAAISNFENKLQSQFQHYLENIEKQINRIIHLAEDVHSQLLDLDTQYETISDILIENYDATKVQLDEIKQKMMDEGFLVKIYRRTLGDGDSDQVKHQHNLEVLKEFKDIVKFGIVDINNVIDRLKRFKAEAAELKLTITEVELAQSMSLNIHIDILKNGIERLNHLKQRLDGRVKQKQIDHHIKNDE